MSKSLFKKDIFEFLNKKYDFEIPDGMIENQLEDFKKKIEQQEKFKNEKERGKVIEKERKEIEKLIRFGIILSDLAKKNKIEATNEDFNNQFIKMLSGFDGDQKTLLDYYKNNPDEIDRLKNFIVEQKIIDFIISTESIEKKQYSTKEFLKLWEKSRDE
jgi:trigger factor